MILRVAEHCFWLHRYLERAENTARLLQVNLALVLDIELPPALRWRPILAAEGEFGRFVATAGDAATADGEAVQEFLTWDPANPVAILNSVRWARENARSIRETISLEMWQALNSFWLWLASAEGRRLYARDRQSFYERVKHGCQLVHGLTHTTMLYSSPFDFMRLGALLERADQTARILGAMWQRVASLQDGFDTPSAQPLWLAALRSCSASESFLKRGQGSLTPATVAEFLLLESAFPRAVRGCLERSAHFLDRITPGGAPRSGALLAELVARLDAYDVSDMIDAALLHELARLMTGNAAVCDAVRDEFFPRAVPVGAAS
jgi:uncharacterized alpha-E superfamily protein